jgi:hypothetical protein
MYLCVGGIVSGHVFVCRGYREWACICVSGVSISPLFLQFFYYVLKLCGFFVFIILPFFYKILKLCGIICFSFYYHIITVPGDPLKRKIVVSK